MLLATELTLYAFYRHVVLYVKIVILVPFRVLTRENKVMLLFKYLGLREGAVMGGLKRDVF